MSFDCTFAGVPFRLPTADVLSHLDRFDYLHHVRDTLPLGQVWPGPKLTQLGAAIPFAYPPLKLGDYFYPAGASRFSIFRGLMTPADLRAVNASVAAGSSGTFTLSNAGIADSDDVETDLYLLPPIPITQPNGETSLFLITLVDERYFWHQWQNAGAIEAGVDPAAWSDLIDQLADQLDIEIDYDDPSSNYGSPEPDSALYSNYESPAALLDAVAANVGCGVVRDFDGSYSLQRFAAAIAAVAANRPDTDLLGGPAVIVGDAYAPVYGAVLPSSVTIVFPEYVSGSGYYEPTTYRQHVMDSYGATYTINVTLASLGSPYSNYASFPGSKVLRTTAKALWASSPPSGDPTNLTDLQNLANQLAQDYFDLRLGSLDETYQGIYAWAPESVSDVLYCWSADVCCTRVLPPPWNAGVSEFQHGLGPESPTPSGNNTVYGQANNLPSPPVGPEGTVNLIGNAGIAISVQDDPSNHSLDWTLYVALQSATISSDIGSGTQTVTPSSMAGIYPGSSVLVDPSGTPEVVSVVSTTGTTFTADFGYAHSTPLTLFVLWSSTTAFTGTDANGNVVVGGSVQSAGPGSSQTGSATIPSGQTTITVPFNFTWATAPSFVSIFPTSYAGTGFTVTYITTTGFDLTIPSSLGSDSTFTWATSAPTSPVANSPVSQDLTAQTGAVSSVLSYAIFGGSAHTVEVGSYIALTAGTGQVLTNLSWTDENGNAQTVYIGGSVGPPGFFPGGSNTIRVQAGTLFTVYTTITGTVTYDVGAWIQQIN